MKFSILLSQLAILSAAFAAPANKGLEKRLARRAARHSSGPLRNVTDSVNAGIKANVDYSTNWSGVVLESPPTGQTFNYVTGTFTAPTPTKPSGVSSTYGEWSSSAWVGIDGDTCQTAILQTGVDFTISTSGAVSYDAWYEWYPDYADDFSLTVSAGDVIVTTVSASTLKKGTATILNQTTGKSVTITLTSSSSLCGTNAEWIVEDYELNGALVAFADFGSVTFTNAIAKTASETVPITGGTIIDLETSSGKVLTSVAIESSSELVVTYV